MNFYRPFYFNIILIDFIFRAVLSSQQSWGGHRISVYSGLPPHTASPLSTSRTERHTCDSWWTCIYRVVINQSLQFTWGFTLFNDIYPHRHIKQREAEAPWHTGHLTKGQGFWSLTPHHRTISPLNCHSSFSTAMNFLLSLFYLCPHLHISLAIEIKLWTSWHLPLRYFSRHLLTMRTSSYVTVRKF